MGDRVPYIVERESIDTKEKKLLEFIRQLGHGEITIKIQDGLPVMIEKTTVKVKL